MLIGWDNLWFQPTAHINCCEVRSAHNRAIHLPSYENVSLPFDIQDTSYTWLLFVLGLDGILEFTMESPTMGIWKVGQLQSWIKSPQECPFKTTFEMISRICQKHPCQWLWILEWIIFLFLSPVEGGHPLLCYVTTCIQRVFLWGLFTPHLDFREPF